MDTKRTEILDTSAALFSKNGFQNTSIQDIAAACNISKATIYKYFSSKEEIGLTTIAVIAEQLADHILIEMEYPKHAPRQQLHENIVIWIERYLHRTSFIDGLIYALSPAQRENYLKRIYHARFLLFDAFSQNIKQAFHLDSDETAYELTLNLNGLVREITFLHLEGINSEECSQAADFILDSLEAIATQRQNKPSILTGERLILLRQRFSAAAVALTPLRQRKQLLETLRMQIASKLPHSLHAELLEAVLLLEKEYDKTDGTPLIADALCLYLAQQPVLAETAGTLKSLSHELECFYGSN